MTKHVSASGAIQIGGFTSGAQSQGSLTVEFGNGTYLTNLRKRRSEEAELRDSKGDILRLHSAAQMLTFLSNNGYDLIDYNVAPFGEASLMYSYLLARKIEPSPKEQ